MDETPLDFGVPPEFYSDSLRIGLSPYGFTFLFGLQSSDNPADTRTQAIVRMSPQHVLVLFQLLKKNLREYQQHIGQINLPDDLYSQLGIDREV